MGREKEKEGKQTRGEGEGSLGENGNKRVGLGRGEVGGGEVRNGRGGAEGSERFGPPTLWIKVTSLLSIPSFRPVCASLFHHATNTPLVRRSGLLDSAPGSQPGGTGFDSRPGRYFGHALHPWARCSLTFAPVNQAVHPFGVGKLVPVSAGG
jgi:hypothetical protein